MRSRLVASSLTMSLISLLISSTLMVRSTNCNHASGSTAWCFLATVLTNPFDRNDVNALAPDGLDRSDGLLDGLGNLCDADPAATLDRRDLNPDNHDRSPVYRARWIPGIHTQ